MINTILFPSSFDNIKSVDEDLKNEYDAVMNTGLWDVIIFHYEKWFHEGKLVLTKDPENPIDAVYRGWMMKADQYAAFFDLLQKHNIRLTTNPEEYEHFHYFPNVYRDIENDTPSMVTVPFSEEVNLDAIKIRFERYMVKDYVKSAKNTDFPKYFTRNTTEDEYAEAMKLFYKYRGDLISGGLCFKEYVDLKTYGDKTNEYRVYYISNNVATITRNSLQADYTPEPPMEIIEKYKDLPSGFYTLDFAELMDGSWKILEAGDGGVSGPSEGQDLEAFYRAMYHCFN